MQNKLQSCRSVPALFASILLLGVICATAPAGLGGEPAAVKKVPHSKDETSLVAIKANPEKFVGTTFILCGGIKVDDYYNFAYLNSQDTHYSLDFVEVGEDTATTTGKRAHLYFPKKIGAALIDLAVKFEKEHHGEHYLMRIRATLDRDAFARDKQWDTMEMLDWQFVTKDYTDWQPWALQKIRDDKAAEVTKAAEERKAKLATAKAADEAAKWRTWTDSKGKQYDAKFGGVAFGKVTLVNRDGSSVHLPLTDLSADDRAWIKNRKR